MPIRAITTIAAAIMRQASIAVIVVCGVPLSASAAPSLQAAKLECAIRTEPDNGNFVRLVAVVRSDSPVEGKYDISVSKQSATGTSRNNQTGSFALTIGTEKVLTTIVLDGSALNHYKALLSVDSDRGKVSCVSP